MTVRLGNLSLTDVAHECYDAAEENGWHDDVNQFRARAGMENNWVGNKLMLVVSELCEAQDELRKGHNPDHIYLSEKEKPEGFLVEMADAVIRIFDLLGVLGLNDDLQEVIEAKLAHNRARGYKHGGKAF